MHDPDERSVNTPAWIIPALVSAWLIFLILFGIKFHVMEVPGLAEMDGYTGMADMIRAGELPRDPYRPMLFPLLTAAAGELTGDSFSGGRLVSSLSALLLVIVVWRMGRKFFGESAGLIAALLTMVNFNIIIYGMSVSTDMMFAALAAALLLVSIKIVEGPKAGLAVLAGFLFTVTFFTRYSAAFILPVPVIAIMISGPETGKSRKLLLAGCFLLSALVFLVPHFTLNTMMFGSPFYNENWKNLAFKLYGAKDWTKFGQSGFDGFVDVIRADPARWISSTAGQFVRAFTSTVYYMGGKGIAGILFATAGTVSIAVMALGGDRRKQLAILFILLLAAGGSATFFSGVRFLLPMAGIYYVAISGLASRRLPARIIPYGLAALLLATGLFTGVRHLRLYVDAHPVEELEAARRLELEHGSDITVLGTFPFMQRYVTYRYIEAEKGEGPDVASIDSWTERLERQILEEDAQFVIIGAPTLASRPSGILESSYAPDHLQIVEDSGAVRVFRVDAGRNSDE